MKLIASEIGLDEEDDILILGFKESNATNYLVLSQNIAEVETDGKSLYIEINDQIFGGYDLIEELTIGNTELEIKLNKEGIGIMGTEKVDVKFSTDNFNPEYLKLVFLRIFKDSNKLKIKNKK